ncbi:hypothetical protein C6370_05305 [Bacillus atrophaeus]|nr:hypothetical protein C6370_05305 [Bacillus atrophaeus]
MSERGQDSPDSIKAKDLYGQLLEQYIYVRYFLQQRLPIEEGIEQLCLEIEQLLQHQPHAKREALYTREAKNQNI